MAGVSDPTPASDPSAPPDPTPAPAPVTGLSRLLRERLTVDGGVLEVRPAAAYFPVCAFLGLWAFQSAWVRYPEVGPVGIIGNIVFGVYTLALGLSFRRPWVRADAEGIASGLLLRRRTSWDAVTAISFEQVLLLWKLSVLEVRLAGDPAVQRIRTHSLQILRQRKAAELVRIGRALAETAEHHGHPIPIEGPELPAILQD